MGKSLQTQSRREETRSMHRQEQGAPNLTVQSCRTRGAPDVQSSSDEMEIQLGRVREMRGGNRIANVPRKMLEANCKYIISRARGKPRERGGQPECWEKEREQYKQNEVQGKIQEPRGFLVTAATVLLLRAQGCMWDRSQASETKHSLVLDTAKVRQKHSQVSSSSPGRHSPVGQGTSKSSSSSRI